MSLWSRIREIVAAFRNARFPDPPRELLPGEARGTDERTLYRSWFKTTDLHASPAPSHQTRTVRVRAGKSVWETELEVLRRCALTSGVTITNTQITRHVLTVTVDVTAAGTPEALDDFAKTVRSTAPRLST